MIINNIHIIWYSVYRLKLGKLDTTNIERLIETSLN